MFYVRASATRGTGMSTVSDTKEHLAPLGSAWGAVESPC